jgi:hypothetical protein
VGSIHGDQTTLITELELARLGDGQVAYIKSMTSAEARRMFPSIKGLPRGIDLYALHAADGTPIALTDMRSMANWRSRASTDAVSYLDLVNGTRRASPGAFCLDDPNSPTCSNA